MDNSIIFAERASSRGMTHEKKMMTYEEIEKVSHPMSYGLKERNYALATMQAFVVYKAVRAYGEQETKEALI